MGFSGSAENGLGESKPLIWKKTEKVQDLHDIIIAYKLMNDTGKEDQGFLSPFFVIWKLRDGPEIKGWQTPAKGSAASCNVQLACGTQ